MAVLFEFVLELSLKVAAMVLKGQNLLTLLEHQGLELTYAQVEVLLSEGSGVTSEGVHLTVTGLEPQLLLQDAQLV